MVDNPYTWNLIDIELFYGRQEQLTELIQGLTGIGFGRKHYSYGFAGGRRMGKTTLLRCVEHHLKKMVEQREKSGVLLIPVYVNGLNIPRSNDVSSAWSEILCQIKRAAPQFLYVDIPQEPLIHDFSDLLRDAFDKSELEPRVVFLFDEIEPLVAQTWGDGYFGNWRSLLSNTDGVTKYISAVFAGAREMRSLQSDVGSPLSGVLEWFELRTLSYDDVCLLAQEPIKYTWSSEFLEKLYEESGGHPMLTQYLMQQVCLKPLSDGVQSLEEAAEQFIAKRRWQFADWWNKYCSQNAQKAYRLFPPDGSHIHRITITSQLGGYDGDEAISDLLHVGLINEVEKSVYCTASDMFRSWYDEYCMDIPATEYDTELYDQLNSVDPQLAKRYLTSWTVYGTELANYSPAVSEMREVLTFLLHTLAPTDEVKKEEYFTKSNMDKPTRRHRVRYILSQRKQSKIKSKSKEIGADLDVLDSKIEQLGASVDKTYARASGKSHGTATKDEAYTIMKQCEALLSRLISRS